VRIGPSGSVCRSFPDMAVEARVPFLSPPFSSPPRGILEDRWSPWAGGHNRFLPTGVKRNDVSPFFFRGKVWAVFSFFFFFFFSPTGRSGLSGALHLSTDVAGRLSLFFLKQTALFFLSFFFLLPPRKRCVRVNLYGYMKLRAFFGPFSSPPEQKNFFPPSFSLPLSLLRAGGMALAGPWLPRGRDATLDMIPPPPFFLTRRKVRLLFFSLGVRLISPPLLFRRPLDQRRTSPFLYDEERPPSFWETPLEFPGPQRMGGRRSPQRQ